MTLGVLRPVGDPAPRPQRPSRATELIPAGYDCHFVQSGTAALALALRLIRRSAAPTRRRVLLPAYACPDLLSASEYAGLEAVLIDTEADSPFLSVENLRRSLDDRVAAVIGVHFLGVREKTEAIADPIKAAGAVLVEDSAQRLPTDSPSPQSPLIVLSFGRGKPAGALGGGALLIKRESYELAPRDVEDAAVSSPAAGLARLLYNFAIAPAPFAVLSTLPFLHIGETRYHPLGDVRRLDQYRKDVSTRRWLQIAGQADGVAPRYFEMLAGVGSAVPLEALRDESRWTRLLRFPVLCRTRRDRDRLHEALASRGLGSSVMYGRSLADLPGLPSMVRGEPGNARQFADRLLTLPTHSAVRDRHLSRIADVLDAHAPRSPAED